MIHGHWGMLSLGAHSRDTICILICPGDIKIKPDSPRSQFPRGLWTRILPFDAPLKMANEGLRALNVVKKTNWDKLHKNCKSLWKELGKSRKKTVRTKNLQHIKQIHKKTQLDWKKNWQNGRTFGVEYSRIF